VPTKERVEDCPVVVDREGVVGIRVVIRQEVSSAVYIDRGLSLLAILPSKTKQQQFSQNTTPYCLLLFMASRVVRKTSEPTQLYRHLRIGVAGVNTVATVADIRLQRL
jgi:hypothetical protein